MLEAWLAMFMRGSTSFTNARRDGGQNSEAHQEFTLGAHEKRRARCRSPRGPKQDVPAHQGLRRQVGEDLRDVHRRGLPGQNAFHPGVGVVPKASALPEGKQVVKPGEEFPDLAVLGVDVFVKLQPRQFFRGLRALRPPLFPPSRAEGRTIARTVGAAPPLS